MITMKQYGQAGLFEARCPHRRLGGVSHRPLPTAPPTYPPCQATAVDSQSQDTDAGKYVAIYRRQSDGSLKLIVDTFNYDTPES